MTKDDDDSDSSKTETETTTTPTTTMSTTAPTNQRAPFGCWICPASDGNDHKDHSGLADHFYKQHSATFCCQYCRQQFIEGHELKHHIEKWHIGPAKYYCVFCHSRIVQKKQVSSHLLENHKMVMKDATCTSCETIFHDQQCLRLHSTYCRGAEQREIIHGPPKNPPPGQQQQQQQAANINSNDRPRRRSASDGDHQKPIPNPPERKIISNGSVKNNNKDRIEQGGNGAGAVLPATTPASSSPVSATPPMAGFCLCCYMRVPFKDFTGHAAKHAVVTNEVLSCNECFESVMDPPALERHMECYKREAQRLYDLGIGRTSHLLCFCGFCANDHKHLERHQSWCHKESKCSKCDENLFGSVGVKGHRCDVSRSVRNGTPPSSRPPNGSPVPRSPMQPILPSNTGRSPRIHSPHVPSPLVVHRQSPVAAVAAAPHVNEAAAAEVMELPDSPMDVTTKREVIGNVETTIQPSAPSGRGKPSTSRAKPAEQSAAASARRRNASSSSVSSSDSDQGHHHSAAITNTKKTPAKKRPPPTSAITASKPAKVYRLAAAPRAPNPPDSSSSSSSSSDDDDVPLVNRVVNNIVPRGAPAVKRTSIPQRHESDSSSSDSTSSSSDDEDQRQPSNNGRVRTQKSAFSAQELRASKRQQPIATPPATTTVLEYVCKLCHNTSRHRFSLLRHIQTQHSVGDKDMLGVLCETRSIQLPVIPEAIEPPAVIASSAPSVRNKGCGEDSIDSCSECKKRRKRIKRMEKALGNIVEQVENASSQVSMIDQK